MRSFANGLVFGFLWLIAACPAIAGINLLVTSADNNSQNGAVRRYDGLTGSFIDVLVPTSALMDMPNGTAIGPDGRLYVSTHDDGEIVRFDLNSGALLGTFVSAGAGGLGTPSDFEFGPDGNLYVPSNNGAVLRFNGATGAFIDVFATGLFLPQDLAFGPNGDLFVTSAGNDLVRQYDGVTGALVRTISHASMDGPHGITFGPDQRLYVTSAFNDSVVRFDNNGGFLDVFVASSSGNLRTPLDLAFGPTGNLYVNSRVEGPFPTRGEVFEFDGTTGAYLRSFVTDGSGGLGVPRGGLLFVTAPVPEPATMSIWCVIGMGVFISRFARKRVKSREFGRR